MNGVVAALGVSGSDVYAGGEFTTAGGKSSSRFGRFVTAPVTPTPSGTATPAATASQTPTVAPTVTATATLTATPTPAGTATPALTPGPGPTGTPVAHSKCDAGKMWCVAKMKACLLAVHGKAEKKGVPPDDAALHKCRNTFDGGTRGFAKGCIGKLETKEQAQKPATLCTVTGDLALLEDKVAAFVEGVVRAINPDSPTVQAASNCDAGKKVCVAKQLRCVLKARLNAVKKDVAVDPVALQKCARAFDGGSKPAKGCIAKLEAKHNPDKPKTMCAVRDGDVAALGAKVDAFVSDVVNEIRNTP
jgi:hypothetical protein